MKKWSWPIIVVVILAASLALIGPADACGSQGCTPGYWKNHLGAWQGYLPTDDFDKTFGVNFFDPDITLEEAVNAKGGGYNALARHAVAALLNAAHSGVNYKYTVGKVINLVKFADSCGCGVECTKDILEVQNELGCPLN